jgi:peroxiredoxin-like protein
MSTQHSYQVKLNWEEGRKGIIESSVLNSKIEVATPPEFPKGVPRIWSPEHLFVASVNSCLMTTFLAIAEYSKLEFNNFECNATGILDKVEGKFMMSEITLHVTLEISDPSKKERAQRIIEKSEKACLISNSIKTNIKLETEILIH